MEKPEGAGAFFDGAWHKLGNFEKPYIYLNGEWVRSTKDPVEVKRRIERERT